MTSLGSIETGGLLGGRYRVGPRLAGGGMADVFLGRDGRLDRQVAIKLLRAETAADPGLRRRFTIEGRAAARLSHPHVVGVFDVGEEQGQPYLVMELVTGGTLAEIIRSGPLSDEVASQVGVDILAGLGAAHAAGILHRDVKPSNVLITDAGRAKLADFGIAKSTCPGDALEATATALVIGTPSYLAPERAAGAPASVASDLWSVGVVLYEALAGVRPFQGPTPLAIVLAARNGEVVPLGERRPDISPGLVGAVERSLRVDPATRFVNAATMAVAIEGTRERRSPAGTPSPTRAVTTEDQTVTSPRAPTDVLEAPALKRGPSRPRVLLAVGSVLAAVALLLGWALAQGRSPSIAHRVPPTTSHAPATTTVSVPSTPLTTTAPSPPAPAPPATAPPAHQDRRGDRGNGAQGNHGNSDNGRGDH